VAVTCRRPLAEGELSPQERAAGFGKALQKLIGYGLSRNGLGYVMTHDPQGLQRTVAMKSSSDIYAEEATGEVGAAGRDGTRTSKL
jgi:hypothetical protein